MLSANPRTPAPQAASIIKQAALECRTRLRALNRPRKATEKREWTDASRRKAAPHEATRSRANVKIVIKTKPYLCLSLAYTDRFGPATCGLGQDAELGQDAGL